MLDVDNAKWISLIPGNNKDARGEENPQTPQKVLSWTNINLNDAQDLLNKAASASPLGDQKIEQLRESKGGCKKSMISL